MHQKKQKLYIRFASFAAVLLLLLSSLPAVQAVSGDCGEDISWELNGGVLTVSGNGPIPNYQEFSLAPWTQYADAIHSVNVESGVTAVGSFAFFSLENLTAVSLADSVKRVGEYAFYGCSALSLLDLGYGVQELGEGAFKWCDQLSAVRLPGSLTTLGFHAFYRCESLQTVTVPASVTNMDSTVFGYCTALKSASVLANIDQLPVWTFYGCENLSQVTLNPAMTSIGTQALEGTQLTQPVTYDVVEKDRVEHTSADVDDRGNMTKQLHVSTPNSAVTTQTTGIQSTVDAVVENEEGWMETVKQADKAEGETVHVNIHLKGQPEVTGQQLGSFAGKDMTLTVHTQQGAKWHLKAEQLKKQELKDRYDLSFTLWALTEPTDAQRETVGPGKAFAVVFHAPLDFKVEVELPLGKDLAGSVATFFAPQKKTYARMQDVLIDNTGAAHFYLGQVDANTEYLIGIDAIASTPDGLNDAIIPDSMKNPHQNIEQVEQIKYVVTGTKSSWGLNIRQVTWILVAVMGGSVLVVGVTIGIMYKRKLKNDYIPEDTQ